MNNYAKLTSESNKLSLLCKTNLDYVYKPFNIVDTFIYIYIYTHIIDFEFK